MVSAAPSILEEAPDQLSGIALTRAHRSAKCLLRKDPSSSDAAIALATGLPITTVANHRRMLGVSEAVESAPAVPDPIAVVPANQPKAAKPEAKKVVEAMIGRYSELAEVYRILFVSPEISNDTIVRSTAVELKTVEATRTWVEGVKQAAEEARPFMPLFKASESEAKQVARLLILWTSYPNANIADACYLDLDQVKGIRRHLEKQLQGGKR